MAMVKGRRVLGPIDTRLNEPRDVFALTLGDRGDAGQGTTVPAADAGCISDGEDIALSGNRKIGFDLDADAKRFTVTAGGVTVVAKGQMIAE